MCSHVSRKTYVVYGVVLRRSLSVSGTPTEVCRGKEWTRSRSPQETPSRIAMEVELSVLSNVSETTGPGVGGFTDPRVRETCTDMNPVPHKFHLDRLRGCEREW